MALCFCGGACDFYPRSPCGERHNGYGQYYIRARISIHALLAESDVVSTVKFAAPVLFLSTLSLRRATVCPPVGSLVLFISIHALLAESDPLVNMRNTLSPVFLSTLSLRRATPRQTRHCKKLRFLSTLSLRRATANNRTERPKQHDFYPRSPCGERPASCRPPGAGTIE